MVKILILKEKHGDSYYDVSTPELLHKTCIYILKERLDEGWYGNLENHTESLEEYCKRKLGMTPDEINKLPESVIKIEAQKRLGWATQDYQCDQKRAKFLEEVQECVKANFEPDAKPPIRDRAFGLLGSRRSHEYEDVDRITVMNLDDV